MKSLEQKTIRLVDFFLAIVALITFMPIILLSALSVKLFGGPGKIIFKQKRVGFHGKEFVIYKLRTMVKDAEKNGAKWCKNNDNRITKIGYLLRIAKLDELLQFFNVLKGEMSLVGPRPESLGIIKGKKFKEKVPDYDERHQVRPGVTGWACIHNGCDIDMDSVIEKTEKDLWYINNQSVLLNLHIIMLTPKAIWKLSIFPKL